MSVWISVSPSRKRPSDYKQRDTLNNLYKLSVTFETITPTCTCTGKVKVDLIKRSTIYLGYRVDGKPAIMGSSIKGVLSTYALIVSNDPLLVANLFGFQGLASRVYVEDGIVIKGNYTVMKLGRQWSPRKHKTRKHKNGIKVYTVSSPSPTNEPDYFEALPRGSEFTTEITVFNSDSNELGLLLASMGVSSGRNYGIKIGRGKDRGFGIIRVVSFLVKEFDPKTFTFKEVKTDPYVNRASQLLSDRWNDVKQSFF